MQPKELLKLALYNEGKSYCIDDEDDGSDWFSTLVDALESVVFYNCLEDILSITKEHLERCLKEGKSAGRPDILCDDSKFGSEKIAQFEVLWMVMSEMFGTCGSSPRYGWVDHRLIPTAIEFINLIMPKEPDEPPF